MHGVAASTPYASGFFFPISFSKLGIINTLKSVFPSLL